MRPSTVLEGVQEAEKFVNDLEKLFEPFKAEAGATTMSDAVEKLGLTVDGLASLEALLTIKPTLDNIPKALQTGFLIGILYEKKVQALKAEIAREPDVLATDARNYQ